MNSVVLDIQRLASDNSSDVLDVLRKTLLVATKLGVEELVAWATRELNGYDDNLNLPAYRVVHGHVTVLHPYQGSIPFVLDSTSAQELISKVELFDGIATIQELIKNFQPGSHLHYPFPAGQAKMIMEAQSGPKLYPQREVSISKLKNLVESVKTKALTWALELEKQNILGEGLSFSKEEKEAVKKISHYTIENFVGVLGDVSGGAITFEQINIRKNSFEDVRSTLIKHGVSQQDIVSLEEILSDEPNVLGAGKFGPKVSGWMAKMFEKASSGSWQIGLGAAGSLLANVIGKFYGLQ